MDTVPTITIEVEPEDMPVRGNAMASGDNALDITLENEILERLERHDIWAWCSVRVVATQTDDLLGVVTAKSHWLGGCCYKNEADFREPGGYFEDLRDEAVYELRAQIDGAIRTVEPGREAFTLDDSRELARLVFKRFGRDEANATAAYNRLLSNNCTVEQFMRLARGRQD